MTREEVLESKARKIFDENYSGDWQNFADGFEEGYNKAMQEIKDNGLALQSDMDKTIEQNIQLKAQIEKMKSDVMENIKWANKNCDNMWQKLVKMWNQWE